MSKIPGLELNVKNLGFTTPHFDAQIFSAPKIIPGATQAPTTHTPSSPSKFSLDGFKNLAGSLDIQPPGSSIFTSTSFKPDAVPLSARLTTLKNGALDLPGKIGDSASNFGTHLQDGLDTVRIHASAYSQIGLDALAVGTQHLINGGYSAFNAASELPATVKNIVTESIPSWAATAGSGITDFFSTGFSRAAEVSSQIKNAVAAPFEWTATAANNHIVQPLKNAYLDSFVHKDIVAPAINVGESIWNSAVATVKDYGNRLISFFDSLTTPKSNVTKDAQPETPPRTSDKRIFDFQQPLSLNTLNKDKADV